MLNKNMIINLEKKVNIPTPGVYSYLNFYSLLKLMRTGCDYSYIRYFCDGMLMCLLVWMLTGVRVKRQSFDFSSMAPNVFYRCQTDNLKVFILGSTEVSNTNFVNLLLKKYSKIDVVGRRNGYLTDSSWTQIAEQIKESGADVVIIGMGAPIQDDFSLELLSIDFSGEIYTCGGFIHQCDISKKFDYYPKLVDKLEIRWLYRMVKEPKTIKRYLIDYPYALSVILLSIVSGRLKLKIQK
jgi:exopolysaccharide biosynthesis WecB/TagA/CpsF family protein